MSLYGDAVVVVRAGTRTTRAGDTVPDWSPGAVTRIAAADVNVQPLSQDERVSLGRDVTVAAWRLTSRRGVDVDITGQDRVEWAGLVLAVDGDPARFMSNGGHVEAVLQLVKG